MFNIMNHKKQLWVDIEIVFELKNNHSLHVETRFINSVS